MHCSSFVALSIFLEIVIVDRMQTILSITVQALFPVAQASMISPGFSRTKSFGSLILISCSTIDMHCSSFVALGSFLEIVRVDRMQTILSIIVQTVFTAAGDSMISISISRT